MSNNSYDKIKASIKSGEAGNLYIFHGEERYLLDRCLSSLRTMLCPDGLDGFNYKRFDGRGLSVDELDDAINTLPFFTDRTLVEIHDFDIFRNDEKQRICDIFSDLPDYICVIFIYSTIEFKPDGRQKTNKEIIKFAEIVEFTAQEQNRIIDWIRRHFHVAGKSINTTDAQYLAFITGGLMATLNGEIEKVAAYSKQRIITRSDIDAVVTPVLDAVVYKLADALVNRDSLLALHLLDDLLQMREAPHKLLFSISLKMRQLLAARICIEGKVNKSTHMKMCAIRYEFQVNSLFDTAKKTTLSECREAVLYCSQTALALNSTSESEECLIELVTKLALK